MNINNGFNTLPWYDSLTKQNHNKWYAYGQSWPLVCPQGYILPFQFICDTSLSISSNIYAINSNTGASIDLGVKPTVAEVIRTDITYYLVKLNSSPIQNLPVGRYYFQMNTNRGPLYSEEFTVVDNPSDYIKVEYWNEDNLKFTHGEINFEDDFRFILYINSTIGKPEYEFEEELTKRLGYKFIESQTSNKIYKFAFAAPEYICDAMRLIRMCDYIKITTKHDSYNALSFSYEPKWQEQGDLASVEVEFDTDCIIQKLESFNRRIKESFYNALLADIDEPVLFSTDTVAQYYTEYTSVSSINGKLIRQLEAISEKELLDSLASIVLPVDNQSDNTQVAKKAFLSDIINKLIPKVDMSTYLLKAIWDESWELRTDSKGQRYIFGKLPVVTQYGITMYADGGNIDLPSLYAGLPIDNTTIYWDNGILKAKGGTEGAITSVTKDMVISALGYTPYNASNPSGYITSSALTGYATQSWVEGKGYALNSDLDAISAKLNNFLEGSDTDNIINKWLELEAFLSGLSESDNLATILAGKVDRTYVDSNFVTINTAQSILGEKNFVGGLKVNGSPIVYDATNKYWKLEGDLLVTGGVTMYGNDSEFVPSTIMDAILYDDTTLGINSSGELYVKGSVGGSSTLGGLSNVGSWADSVADVDRIMYQASGSSMWVAKALSSIGLNTTELQNYLTSNNYLNTTSGDNRYLKLSGGNLTGSLTISSNTVYHTGNLTASSLGLGNVTNLAASGYLTALSSDTTNAVSITVGGTTKNITAATMKSSLGLGSNAYTSTAYLPTSGGSINGALTISTGSDRKLILNNTDSDTNYTRIDFQQNGVSIGQLGIQAVGSSYLSWTGDGENHRILHAGNIANYNAGSATKLQTARTIWGQSFDGTGNVTGDIYTSSHSLIGTYGGAFLFSGIRSGEALSIEPLDSSGERLRQGITLLQTGYVGMNTLRPKNRLSVYGGVSSVPAVGSLVGEGLSVGYSGSYGIHLYTLTNGMGAIQCGREDGEAIAYALLLNPHDGNVGIGTINPYSKLHSVGDITVSVPSNNSTASINFMNTSSDLWQISGRYTSLENGTFKTYYYNGSTWSTIVTLYNNGNMLVSGGVTMYSDIRKKTKLKDVVLSLQQVANAPLIEHYYNSDDKRTTHVGSIAQYWAGINDWFCKLDNEGYYTMEIQNAALASAISVARELDRYESKTDKKIKQLKKRICQLEDELERLKSA